MKESIHYLLMSDHMLVQKALLGSIKESGLTLGQPKILDYLKDHNGCVQKDIAAGCHIEPASITVICVVWKPKAISQGNLLAATEGHSMFFSLIREKSMSDISMKNLTA